MSNSLARSAAFVRNFFDFLEARGICSAVLHDGEDGFERALSDVDFMVSQIAFSKIADLINAYCSSVGWQLCQILRHETTAAFCVCSAIDDPECVVALDACSDYQRNGTLFLTADELLETRQPLPWGGHRLKPNKELCYRFAKAAAKHKDITTCAREFSAYPEDARRDCAAWLEDQWGISLKSWDSVGLVEALTKLRAKSNQRPSLTQPGALERIANRILRPTGLIVITGFGNHEAKIIDLQNVFGHLYFRRILAAARWQPAMFKDLIASTLIILPEVGTLWTKLIPRDCIHRLDPSLDFDNQFREIAKNLHHRCKCREIR